MLSPPKFTDDIESSSILCDKSFDIIPSEELPCSPESYSTSLKSLFELLEQGISLLEGRQVPAGLKVLQELLEKITVTHG